MLNSYRKIQGLIFLLFSFSFLYLTNIIYTHKHQSVLCGKASWYGPGFHGRKTSNGEVFNKDELTAAHRTLPFNTKVLVTNLKNNKSVLVRINDRGPFIKGRIIDLSEKAAENIDSKMQGIAQVKIQILAANTASLQ